MQWDQRVKEQLNYADERLHEGPFEILSVYVWIANQRIFYRDVSRRSPIVMSSNCMATHGGQTENQRQNLGF